MSRILIVEDEPKMIETIQRALKPLGYPLDAARNGNQALKLIDRTDYGLLVTDLMMPERTGFDLLEALHQRGSKIPVIVCSAFVTPDALKGLGRGLLVEVVPKPFKSEILAAAAKKLIEPPPEK